MYDPLYTSAVIITGTGRTFLHQTVQVVQQCVCVCVCVCTLERERGGGGGLRINCPTRKYELSAPPAVFQVLKASEKSLL